MFRWYRARNEREKVGVPEQAFFFFSSLLFPSLLLLDGELRGERGEERRGEENAQEFSIVGRQFLGLQYSACGVWNRP